MTSHTAFVTTPNVHLFSNLAKPFSCHRRHPRASAGSSVGSKPQFPDFNREYYDDLKKKYEGDPGVRIHSRDDYELDPMEIPWLYDYRGRNLDVVRENVRKRVEQHKKKLERKQNKTNDNMTEDCDLDDECDDEDGFPPNALQWTDFHTEEEIANLRENAKVADIGNGRIWSTPMSEEELKFSEEHEDGVHLRPMGENDPQYFPTNDSFNFWGDDPQNFASSDLQADALAALEECAARMSSVPPAPGANLPAHTWGEQTPAPDPEEYCRWQREAEIRGGNAVVGESQDLAPYADVFPANDVSDQSSNIDVPLQYQLLIDKYSGSWTGNMSIFRLAKSKSEKIEQFEPQLKAVLPTCTKGTVDSTGTLQLQTKISLNEVAHDVDVPFASLRFGNGLAPARAVAHDASYVCVPQEHTHTSLGFSIPAHTLTKLIAPDENSSSRPIIEICLLQNSAENNEMTRQRIFLFSDGHAQESDILKGIRLNDNDFEEEITLESFIKKPERPKKFEKHKFTHVIVISDKLENSVRQCESNTAPVSLPSLKLSNLMGKWCGNALLIQPEYLPEGIRYVETKRYMQIVEANSLKIDDVTLVKDKFEAPPSEESKREVRQAGKRKVSARVAAARAHDNTRLASCTVLASDTVGDMSPTETHAWRIHNEDKSENEEISTMVSPRIGRFVDDYAAIALVQDNLLLEFPHTRAFPTMWNTVTVTELCPSHEERRRVVVGRSGEGLLVGALFVKEKLEVEDLSTDSTGEGKEEERL